MTDKIVKVGNVEVANNKPFTLFGGMNVLESRDMAMRVCEKYVEVTQNWACLMYLKPLLIKRTALRSTLTVDQEWKRG